MELAFEPAVIAYLRNTADLVSEQTEAAEIIIPDSWPDAVSVCSCFGEALLRGKDRRNGCVILSGGIRAGIFYHPDGEEQPRVLECYLPFTVKAEGQQLKEDTQILCQCTLSGVEAGLLNSRKLRFRGEICCRIRGWEQAEETIGTIVEPPQALQLRTQEYRLMLPLEMAEKSFVVSDTLQLPQGSAELASVCKCICTPWITDQKLIGSKAVFKGVIRCAMLYADSENRLHRWQAELPFSQYCQLKGDYDEEQVEVFPLITGYDLQKESEQAVSVTVNILAQCLVTGSRTVMALEDAYVTKGELTPQWQTVSVAPTVDTSAATAAVRQMTPTELTGIYDWDVYSGRPAIHREKDGVRLELPMKVKVTGTDSSGVCRSETVAASAETVFALSEQCSCSASFLPLRVQVTENAGMLLTDAEASLSAVFTSRQPLQTLSGGTWTDGAVPSPQLLVRTVDENTCLWDVAKQYGSTVSSIQAANDLQGSRMPQTELLLIPIG